MIFIFTVLIFLTTFRSEFSCTQYEYLAYTVLTVYVYSTRSGYCLLYDLACMTHLITAKIYELSMQTSRGQGQITVEF
eukprot:COSAG05_NODE_158_length_15673_cov_23.898946_8_plen_78_part_00